VPKGKQLSDKQERFCQEYLLDMNATQAYKRAGYSVKSDQAAGVEGHKLLKNPKIQERVKQLQEKRSKSTGITADRVLKELATIGFSKITDFLKVSNPTDTEVDVPLPKKLIEQIDEGEDDDPMDDIPKIPFRFSSVEIFNTDDMDKEAIPAIASIKQGRNGVELKLHDKVKSLELIGKHLGMFTENVHLTADAELKALYKTVMGIR
jgi:phage terminase small subunit